ncbi:ketopantoate reductase family protein [Novosphingobium album (ex Liu et al. 2023)]|uniref:2-dehydropantoate 2-reductase n=1 Tax=Novosphingobium album (ex Liu et al. 2023) TaxID=3031130 RepID=A0ABT5WRG2_9SPHN|nr:2-dehydropantoate 2-reductase [Novosphingobium album (ex Liu et al. 2023)]MDE8652439.1 2-dehydropantoate 2-reductase [Novosphingobium album (ex Liu et al. 2023)]
MIAVPVNTDQQASPSILVIGAGAVGSFLAAALARTGRKVTLVARGERLEQLRRGGILLGGGCASTYMSVSAADWGEVDSAPGLVILCVKSFAVKGVLDRLASKLGTDSTILTLQNGIDAPGEVARRCPQVTVVAGRLHGFFVLDGAQVRHIGVAPSICYGLVHGLDDGGPAQVGAVLTEAGIAAEASSDIERDLWEKFVLAAALGGVGAALDIPAGKLLSDPIGCRLLHAALRELVLLATHKGIALSADFVARTLALIATFPADATTSLQRDFERGGPSEYRALAGAALRMGEETRLGLPALRRIEDLMLRRGLDLTNVIG